jgi:predicted dehydrogenase
VRLGEPNTEIDVVYVVTPNALHLEHTLKAAKRKLAVAYRCQFEPNNLECIRLARSKKFGELRLIEAAAAYRRPRRINGGSSAPSRAAAH